MLSYPAGIVARQHRKRKKKQSCLSTEDDVRATAGGEMIEVLLWWHSHTHPSFFPFTPLRFLSPFVASSGVGISAWWYTSLLFYALYIIRPVHWLLLLCGNFQGLAWGRAERKKERQTHSDNQRPQQFFMTHCMLSLQEKWAGGKKKDWITCLYSLWGLWAHFLLCCDLNAPSALTNLHLRPT